MASQLGMALMSVALRCVQAAATAISHASRESRGDIPGESLLWAPQPQGSCRLLQNALRTTGLHYCQQPELSNSVSSRRLQGLNVDLCIAAALAQRERVMELVLCSQVLGPCCRFWGADAPIGS